MPDKGRGQPLRGQWGLSKVLQLNLCLLPPLRLPFSQLEISSCLHSLTLCFGFHKFRESITTSNVNIVIFLFYTFWVIFFLYCVLGRCLTVSLLQNTYSDNPFGNLKVFTNILFLFKLRKSKSRRINCCWYSH